MRLFQYFRLLLACFASCLTLGALSTSAFALMGGAVQTGTVALGNAGSAGAVSVSTLAGSAGAFGTTDGTGAAARFNYPGSITTDGTNLYVADTSSHTIRKVVIATGVVSTLAGSAGNAGANDGTGIAAQFNYPHGITTDGTNLFVADTYNHTIRMVVIATGAVTTIAGSAGVIGSANGAGANALFNQPEGITTDGQSLFIADTNNQTIRRMQFAGGAVSTFAGTTGGPGAVDATGVAAKFFNIHGITTDGTNLYVADLGNQTIRKVVIATAAVTTLAGSVFAVGSSDGTGAAAQFNNPESITTDGTNLYVTEDSHIIRRVVIATGVVTTLAGSAGVAGTADGVGTAARFNYPHGITTDGTNLYVANSWSHTIRKISGSSNSSSSSGSSGSLSFAYVANQSSNDVSAYSINATTGALTAVPGSPFAAGSGPNSVTVDPTGKFAYATNAASNDISVYTINQTTGALSAGAAVAAVPSPYSISVDPTGRFAYVANFFSNSVSAYTINTSTGALTAGATIAAGTGPTAVTVDPTGKFAYVANKNSNNVSVYTINTSSGALTAGTAVAAGAQPVSVTVDPSGKFAYVANSASNNVSIYAIDASSGALTPGSPATAATGVAPFAVAVDPTGRFAYVANLGTSDVSVFAINQSSGALTAGTPVAAGGNPLSVAVDRSGKFAYVANQVSNDVSVYTINTSSGALTAGNPATTAAGTASRSIAIAAITVNVGQSVNLGANWNLLGNSVNAPLTVANTFGNPVNVSSVWKWIHATSKWAFYTPSIGDGGAAYAASQGYDFLTTINGGEGFWVNANTAFTVSLPAGATVTTSAFKDQFIPPNNLPAGWSLIAVGDNPTASGFNNNIGVNPPAPNTVLPNLISLWAWSNTASSWYFYAPSLDANGTLAGYITSQGYLNFSTPVVKTLGPTMGFWVNHP